jgi:HK97 family phage portal protein
VGLLSRLFGGTAKAAEGAMRDGPYYLDGGWLPAGTSWNFWQMGQAVKPYSGSSAMVEACISAYSQTVAMCPGDHWRRRADGGRDRVKDSPLARIIARPNEYQSISDFLLNAVRMLYAHGNFYALAVRDANFNVTELHLMQSHACMAQIAETGEVFYHLNGNTIIERRFGAGLIVPARDVLHVRLHTPRDPLKGESPIVAAALDVAATNAALQQQLDFLINQARPSIMLSTEAVLKKEQVAELRASWDERTRGENAGGTPILTAGLKPVTVSTSATDAQVAEMLKLNSQNIAVAFRMPLQILGLGGTTYSSTELLMQSWIATGLGFTLNHIEEAMGHLFGLRGYPEEYVEFNTKALQRSAFKERMEGLALSAISGIHSPDEARNEIDLPTVPGGYGTEPRVQQQVVPLSYWEKMAAAVQPAPPVPPDEDETDRAIAALRMKFAEELHVNRH